MRYISLALLFLILNISPSLVAGVKYFDEDLPTRTGKHGFFIGFELEIHRHHLIPLVDQFGISGEDISKFTVGKVLEEHNLNRKEGRRDFEEAIRILEPDSRFKIEKGSSPEILQSYINKYKSLRVVDAHPYFKALLLEQYQTSVYPKDNADPILKELFAKTFLDQEMSASMEFSTNKASIYKSFEEYLYDFKRFAKFLGVWEELQEPLSPKKKASLHLHVSQKGPISGRAMFALADYKLAKVLASPYKHDFLRGYRTLDEERSGVKAGEKRSTVTWFQYRGDIDQDFSVNRRASNHIEDKLQVLAPEEETRFLENILGSKDLDRSTKTLYHEMLNNLNQEGVQDLLARLHSNYRTNMESFGSRDPLRNRHYSVDFLYRLYSETKSPKIVQFLSESLMKLEGSDFIVGFTNELVRQARSNVDKQLIDRVIADLVEKDFAAFRKHFFEYSGDDYKMKNLTKKTIIKILDKYYVGTPRESEFKDILDTFDYEPKMRSIINTLQSRRSCRVIMSN